VERTHAGALHEERQPIGRTHAEAVCEGLHPMGGIYAGAGEQCKEGVSEMKCYERTMTPIPHPPALLGVGRRR